MGQQQRSAFLLAAVLALASAGAAAQTPPAAAGSGAAQAAHAAAEAGYQAYARRDFAAAVAAAQRATALHPQRRDYWLLLAQAQLAAGQPQQAEEALARAAQIPGDDAALARARSDLARVQAQSAGEAMYRALQADDLAAAIAAGERALVHAPDNTAYRLVLAQALLRAQRHADAERLATETLGLLPGSAAPLVLRAYARQGLGRADEAGADLTRALHQRGLSEAMQRELRLMAADLALAQGRPQQALDLLQPLAPGSEVAQRRDLARQHLARPGAYALRAPAIDCSEADAVQGCSLRAAAPPPLPGFAHAAAAYAALERGAPGQALEQVRLATAAAPMQRDWQLLHMNAARAAGETAEAERAATAALALGPADGPLLAQRAALRRQLGDVQGANADAEAALAAGGLEPQQEALLLADLNRLQEARARLAALSATQGTPQAWLDLAYLATRMDDDEAARDAFVAADRAGGLPATALMDAGYASMRTHRDEEAVGFFRRAVDAVHRLELRMEPQALYDTRRTIADLTRRSGVLTSLTLRNGSAVEPGFGVTGAPDQRVLQAGAEAYWRPWGWRNGRFVELFVRDFAVIGDAAGGTTGWDSLQGGIGARWKPLGAHNLVLSLSRVFGPRVEEDWLAQAGYSLDRGSDLRVGHSSWWTTRMYAELGRYLEAGNNYAVGSLTSGRSYRVGGDGPTVLFPHALIAAETSSNLARDKTAAGLGVGLGLRRWFREDTYHAPRSYWDVTLQYRHQFAGDDDRMQGVFLNVLMSY